MTLTLLTSLVLTLGLAIVTLALAHSCDFHRRETLEWMRSESNQAPRAPAQDARDPER